MGSITAAADDLIASNRSIDTSRPLKVIIVGAGISGMLTAIKLRERLPQKLSLTIYDKNEELGGTWFENTYPGCACDIPAHCYQLSFESNPAWSQFYATSAEILEYWKHVAEKYDIRKLMKLSHRVVEARWDKGDAKWKIVVEDLATGQTVHDDADVFITGIGLLNEWKWPQIAGLHNFKGQLLHSAKWDASFDHKGKLVAVIGAGSTGIQIVPSIQPQVSRLDHYVRGKTWIATPMAAKEVHKRTLGTGSNFSFTKEEIKAWQDDPKLYLAYRQMLEEELQTGYQVTLRGSTAQTEAKKEFIALMTERLAGKPEIIENLLPNFSPLCKRLTPGPGYLEALTQNNVEVIPTSVERVTETGILTRDGKHREVDAIICATGFDTSFRNRFPIYGEKGILLDDKWSQRPQTYLSLATDGFPNFFMSLGPNSAIGTGNLLIMIEHMAGFTAQCVEKIQMENVRTLAPSSQAVSNFTRFCDSYFKRTVFSEECSSWYKGGGSNVTGLWPGSSLHAIRALEKPRWEDFDFTYADDNAFGWFGDGSSVRDHDVLSKVYYLKESFLDEPLPSN